MRPTVIFAVMITAVMAENAAGQPIAPTNPDTAPPSLLTPAVPVPLPFPTPIAPESSAPLPPAAPDLGTVTAVPLPPPIAMPSGAPPAPSIPQAPSAAAAVPATGAPISLAPPRPAQPGPTPRAQNATPGSNSLSAKFAPQGAKAPTVPLASNNLPEPTLSPEASPTDFLRAARGALAAGRNGEARSALEMAQTRLLDRVEDAGKEQLPSNNIAVKQISEAIDALVANDRMACLRYIEFASQTLGSPLD